MTTSGKTKRQAGLKFLLGCLLLTPLFSCLSQPTNLESSTSEVTNLAVLTEEEPRSFEAGPKQFSGKNATTGPLDISIEEAILLSLENNTGFKTERLAPQIRQTFEIAEQAVFDPKLSADYTTSRESKNTTGGTESITGSNEVQAAISTTLPTGTEMDLAISTTFSESSVPGRQNKVRGGLSITQAMLDGFGLEVNLANLRQARLDTRASLYELRGAAETLVAEVEKNCWELLLAQQRIAIVNGSLQLAEDQLLETQERIKIGKLAAVELYAAQAEVALRRGNLIDARSNLALTRLKLQGLINQTGIGSWDREINIADPIIVPEVKLEEPATHVQVALKWRPEVNQTRLEMKHGDLELVKTKNGLLPALDFFVSLGKSGYADSFTNSINDLDGDSYDISSGISIELPVHNRAANTLHKRAQLNRQLTEIAFQNLVKLVGIDVRSALIEVNRTKEQISATAATRKFQAEALKGETEKFRVGKSTALLVAQAQRDFTVSQIAEVEAVVKHLKALIELYRLEGSLLERRGIIVPG